MALVDNQGLERLPKNDPVLTIDLIIPNSAINPGRKHVAGSRPSDDILIHLFSQDVSSQTSTSEIVSIKELLEIVVSLKEDAEVLKEEVHFVCSSMLASFEARMQQKSIELYVKMNEKVQVLETLQKEKLEQVRRAFTQQLSNALVFINSYYSNYFTSKLTNQQQSDAVTKNRVRELSAVAKSNDATIKMLMDKLGQYEDGDNDGVDEVRYYDFEEDDSDQAGMKQVRWKEEKEQESKHQKQLDTYVQKIEELENQLKKSKTEASAKEDALTYQKRKVEKLNIENERNKQLIQNLKTEGDHQDQQKGSVRNAYDDKKRQSETVESNVRERSENERLITRLMQEKKSLESELSEERVNSEASKLLVQDVVQFKSNELRLQAEIHRLKQELNIAHKSWEKKFAILQQSLYALKDESFLRQSLQRQSALLHQATVSYAYDSPSPIDGQHSAKAARKKKLPQINQQRAYSPTDVVPIPILRNKRNTLENENQITTKDDELPQGFVLLPPPPMEDREH